MKLRLKAHRGRKGGITGSPMHFGAAFDNIISMHLGITPLQHLVTVARVRSFRRAAEELAITQPALSRSIAALEQRIGVRVFDRGRSGVFITPVGASVISEAERLLRTARTLESNLRLLTAGETGEVAFGMGPMIASVILPKLGAEMFRDRPQLRMRCSIKSADVLIEELMNDEIELLFCGSGQLRRSEDVVVEPTVGIDFGVFVRSTHPLLTRDAVLMSDLTVYPLAGTVDLAELDGIDRAGVLLCDNYHILRDVVLESDGLLMTSMQMVTADLISGRMRRLNIVGFPFPTARIAAVYLNGRTLSPAAQVIKSRVSGLIAESPGILERPT